MPKTRILLADDHPLVRGGLRRILDQEPDLQVIDEVDNGSDAVRRALEPDVDLAILDLAMPRLTGLQAAAQLHHRRPALRVLILSMYDNEQYVLAAARSGARGYVLKSLADQEVVDACRSLIRGEAFVFPSSLNAETRRQILRAEEANLDEFLTPRELEILKLVAEGHTTKEIASLLVISPKTVETHRGKMIGKLGARDRVDLTRYAIRRGLVQP